MGYSPCELSAIRVLFISGIGYNGKSPLGLKNYPLHLKLFMDKLLGDMALTVIHDILIATDKTLEHHLRVLSEVL